MPFLFLRAFTSTKTRIMKANGEMGAEDYAQIKKLCLTLTIDDIKDDIIKLVELVKKNHPNGVSFLEDVKADFSDNDNPSSSINSLKQFLYFRSILMASMQIR